MKSTETVKLPEVEIENVPKDFVTMPLDNFKSDSVIVSIASDGVSKKTMELPLETTDLSNSTSLLQVSFV